MKVSRILWEGMKTSKEGARIRLTWQRDEEGDVEEAREFFTKLTRQGWLAARRDGEYRRVLEFRPEYGELWFIPISEGG
jgi:hypothetical protein